jgi:hypothetical protein
MSKVSPGEHVQCPQGESCTSKFVLAPGSKPLAMVATIGSYLPMLLPSELAYVSMANVTCLSSEANSVAAIEQDWQGLPVVPTLCTEFDVD